MFKLEISLILNKVISKTTANMNNSKKNIFLGVIGGGLISFFNISLAMGQASSSQFNGEVVISYDVAGNRINRQYLPGMVRKDPNVKSLPMSKDSAFIAEFDAPVDSLQVPNSTTGETQKVFKTWIGEQDIAIYPNPTQGYLSIGLKNFQEVKSCSVEIINMQGQVAFRASLPQRVYQVDLSDYPAGNYYINLVVDGRLGSFTVVKQ